MIERLLIKVCGITDLDQLNQLAEYSVDYVGLNFYPDSPRYLRDTKLSNPTPDLKKVGVFVNASEEDIYKTASDFALDIIQLHGDEEPEFVAKISQRYPVIKAFGLDDSFDFQQLQGYEDYVAYFLFDTRAKTYGGSGKQFDWQLLEQYQGSKPYLLSGGIRPGDITNILAIEDDRLIGIDVNSGFETSPGIKDMKLIKTLTEELI